MLTPHTDPGSLQVLVVDDNAELRSVLERSLRRLGHEVVVAVSGQEALKALGEHRFQVVFTDIQMPGMDGHTLLRRIASQGLDTAVIVMSGAGTMDDVVDVLRAGAVDYLQKPWSAAVLVSALGRAEEVHNQRRGARSIGDAQPATMPSAVFDPHPAAAPEVVDRTRAPFASLLDLIRQGQITLPSVPLVVRELRGLMVEPNADVNVIASVIERDPALATQVLRLSNTAAYARLGRNSSLKAAMGRIGLRQVQGLVETITARQCYELRLPELRPLQARISQLSLARAVCNRALAELLGATSRIDPEVAYMTGLLADAGASFLLWVAGEQRVDGEVTPTVTDCLELIQTYHEEVGARILHSWNMDAAVVMVAQTHHAGSPPAPPSDYWNLVVLGTDLAERIAPGADPTRGLPRQRALVERCAADLAIGPTVMHKLQARVQEEFQSISEALGQGEILKLR